MLKSFKKAWPCISFQILVIAEIDDFTNFEFITSGKESFPNTIIFATALLNDVTVEVTSINVEPLSRIRLNTSRIESMH